MDGNNLNGNGHVAPELCALLDGAADSPAKKEILAELRVNTHSYRAGQHLLVEGDCASHVMYVSQGWLALSKSLVDGQTQIIDLILPGNIVLPAAADMKTSAVQVAAVTDAVVTTLKESRWAALRHDWPELDALAQRRAAAAQARLSERMLRLGRGSASMRIAYVLLELCVRLHTDARCPETVFHIPLTQQQLGEFAGLSSVHVCRTMRRMARNNVISVDDHMDIRIRDLGALCEMAEVDFQDLAREIEAAA